MARPWLEAAGLSLCRAAGRRGGGVAPGRAGGERGAGYNADSVHVAYLGGVRRPVPGGSLVGADTRTAEQRSALRALVGKLRGALGDLPVVGHRDLSPDRDGDGRVTPREWMKLCPCFDVATEL